MSGGWFNYYDSGLEEWAAKLALEIKYGKNIYSKETLREFKKCHKLIKLCQLYMHRVDWLLSGDDGENSFHQRLAFDLESFKKQPKIKVKLRKCKHCYYFEDSKCLYLKRNCFADMDGEKSCQNFQKDATDCYGFESRKNS